MSHAAPGEVPPLTEEQLAYNNAGGILAYVYTFTFIALTTVVLRTYVRLVMLKMYGSDDYVMLFAMACSLATMACFILETQKGLGRHFLAIPPTDLPDYMYIMFYHNIVVMLTASLVKISVGLFLLRLAQRPAYKKFLWGMIAFLICFTLACFFTLVFNCIPVKAAWDYTLRPPTGDAKCFSRGTFTAIGLFNSSINIATDITFAVLPIPLLWKLQVNRRTKASLMAIMSLGFFACVAAIVKIVQQVHTLNNPDWTTHAWFHVWFDIEGNVGITAASLPTLKPLFGWLLDTARAITTGKSASTGTSTNGSGSANSALAKWYHRGSRFGYNRNNRDRSDKSNNLSSTQRSQALGPNAPAHTHFNDFNFELAPQNALGPSYNTSARRSSYHQLESGRAGISGGGGGGGAKGTRGAAMDGGLPTIIAGDDKSEDSVFALQQELGYNVDVGRSGGIVRTMETEVTVQ